MARFVIDLQATYLPHSEDPRASRMTDALGRLTDLSLLVFVVSSMLAMGMMRRSPWRPQPDRPDGAGLGGRTCTRRVADVLRDIGGLDVVPVLGHTNETNVQDCDHDSDTCCEWASCP